MNMQLPLGVNQAHRAKSFQESKYPIKHFVGPILERFLWRCADIAYVTSLVQKLIGALLVLDLQ